MSYDITLFRPDGNDNLIEQGLHADNLEKTALPCDNNDKLRTALVKDLLSLHPDLQIKDNKKGFSYGCWIGNLKVDCDVPYISIGIATAFISVPCSADPLFVCRAFEKVLKIFEQHGYVAYDNQLDQIVYAKDMTESIKMLMRTKGTVTDYLTDQGEYIL